MEIYPHETASDVLILAADGGLTRNTSEAFVTELEEFVTAGSRKLVIDCSRLTYISSWGIAILLRLRSVLEKAGGQVKMANVKGAFFRILALSKLDTVFEIYDDIPSALAAVRRRVDSLMKTRILLALASVFLFIGPADAQKKGAPRITWDEKTDLGAFRTFGFAEQKNINKQDDLYLEIAARLKVLLREELDALGYRYTSKDPDFLITWDGAVNDTYDIWGGFSAGSTDKVVWVTYVPYKGSRSQDHGVVILMMKQPGSDDIFWGGGQTFLAGGNEKGSKVWKKIEKAVTSVVRAYPPVSTP